MNFNINLKNHIEKFINTLPSKAAVGNDHLTDIDIESLLEYADLVLFQINTLGEWVFLSSNWTSVSGHHLEESLNKSHYSYIHPDDLSDYKKFFLNLLHSKAESNRYSLRIICKNNEYKWFELTAQALYEKDETKAVGVSGVLRDIHDETVMAHRTKVRLQSLEKIIECVPGMIYRGLNNTKWTMEFVSSGCYEITGYMPEDLIKNHKLSFASLIHPEDRQYVWNEVQCALDENRIFDLTYRILTAHGTEKWVWERGQGVFSSSGELLILEGYIADITEDKKADEVRKARLLYDEDSNMPNWLLFNDRLSEAIRRRNQDSRYAFVFILLQIDKYDEIINIYGRSSANMLVVEIQKKILKNFENNATISRANEAGLGILLESIDGFNNLNRLIQNIHEIILLPVQVNDYEIYATASLGVTLSTKQYSNCNELIYDTEQALSRARALGGARHEVFDLKQHAKAAAQSKHEQEVRSAQENRSMQVWWQPVVGLKSQSLAGLEAKLVWNHPQRGNLFAEQFVPRINDTQLLMQLWEFMLSDTCYHMNQWKSITDFDEVGINIQIFGETLLAADSVLRLGEKLLESKPQFCSISLGVPENVFLQATDTVKEVLGWLQSKKISIILDSFGEGLCSLATLKRYPLDMIRLHPSLLDRDHCDPRFVKSIVSLVHSFDIPVAADRLSDHNQLNAAIEYDIDFVQGPIVSNPVPSPEIPEIFKKNFAINPVTISY